MAQKRYKQKKNKSMNKADNHDVLGVSLIIISLFLLLCIVIPPILSVVSEAVFSIVLGIFGIAAYPALIAMLLWGIFLMMRRPMYGMSVKNTVCTILLLFFALIIFQLASTHAFLNETYSAYIADVYSAKYSVGGVIMGTIAFGLKTILTEIGCYIIFSAAVLIVVAVMLNVISRIRALRVRTAKEETAKMPPAPGFTTQKTPQNVMPVDLTPGLYVGTITPKASPQIVTETGRASEIAENEQRVVTDYNDEPVMLEPKTDKKVSAAHVALYGDSDAVKKKAVEEYMRRTEGKKEERKQAPPAVDPQPRDDYAAAYENDVVEPYIRTAADAQANVSAAAPKKIVHESPNVVFPVEKHLVFNDEGIENADDIKYKLREDTKKRKLSDMENSAVAEREEMRRDEIRREEKRTPPEVFMPIKRNDAPVEPPRDQAPIIDADLDRTIAPPTRFDIVENKSKPAETRESVEERFLRTFKHADNEMPRFEPEPNVQDDIINSDLMRVSTSAPENKPTEDTVDPDDIMIGDESPADKREGVFKPSVSARAADDIDDIGDIDDIVGDDSGIVDGSEDDIDDGIVDVAKTGRLSIVNAPPVDMTERHDITRDLIDGEDNSGMYTAVDEQPAVKPSRQKKGVMPIDNQISIQSVLEEKSEETIALSTRKRHKAYDDYVPPPIDLLKKYESDDMTDEDLKHNAQILETVISGFVKSPVSVINIVPGPTVTRYELECQMGVPVKQIESHSQDIEYELAALSHIRIEAPIPGKRAIGIEVPNAHKSIVGIREIIESPDCAKAKSPMTFAVGKGISGDIVLCDLEKVPHLLIAGQTGSGKSACLNGLIVSLLYKSSPADLRFILVDPKRVEFSAYAGMPHLLFNNIIYEPNEVLNALKWGVNEMERRYALLQKYRCNQLSAFNKQPDVVGGKIDKLPHIIIIIDELADIMQSAVKRDIEEKIKTIAAKARAAGIHLIVATQRPSADVLTGTIKTNLTSRIAFKVSSQLDSRIILDVQGAEALVGKGDMLFYPVDYSAAKRVQGSFISDEEVALVLAHIKDTVLCDFDDDAMNAVFGTDDDGGGSAEVGLQKAKGDPLLPDVLSLVIRTKQASTSSIQRRFSIGFARASRIMDTMEEQKYIGPATGNSKPREVFITREQYRELFGRDVEESN